MSPIVGMVYYDPWLAFYLKGSEWATGGHRITGASFTSSTPNFVVPTSSTRLVSSPVQKKFDSWDMALTGSFNGQTLPQDVANICNWTHMCERETNPNNPHER